MRNPRTDYRALAVQLAEESPDLEVVVGQVETYGEDHALYNHTWCVDPTGKIHDPSRDRFPCWKVTYHPAKGSPTGKCLHCGHLSYSNEDFCGDPCRVAFAESLGP